MTHRVHAQPALLQGQAHRISAADKAAMELQARPAVLRATIQITRAATGKVEEYELIGTADAGSELPDLPRTDATP
jgi:hypothetical protein